MINAIVGGIMIGVASGLVFLLLGRLAGVTGIVAGAWPAPDRWWTWRAAFLAGLLIAGAIGRVVSPTAVPGLTAPIGVALVAGLLAGFGARYGGGCTSGHGVCGVGRLSRRSIAGCATFMIVAMIVVFVARHGGAAS